MILQMLNIKIFVSIMAPITKLLKNTKVFERVVEC
jgi:hypothetical protein